MNPNDKCDGNSRENTENISGNISENISENKSGNTSEPCADQDIRTLSVDFENAEYDGEFPESTDTELPKPKKLGLIYTIPALLSLGIAIFSVILRWQLASHPGAGEIFYRYVSRYLQAAMGAVTSFLPFSLAETLLILLPLVAVIILVNATYNFIKGEHYKIKRTLVCLFTAVCLVISNFVLNLSILYCRPSLEQLTGLGDGQVGADELCTASLYSVIMITALEDSGMLKTDIDGATVCPYSFSELDEKIDSAFDSYAEKNDWLSPYGAKAKIIAFSDYMTYTHISGIYTQYTGEANININYPDYVVCSTIAHEKAHQRGIAPEDEANLVAFFVLCESSDPYLQYCGYMSVLTSLLSDTYKAAPEFYRQNIAPNIPETVRGEYAAYSKFFKKYEKSEASKKAEKANDTYIRMNGDSNGTASYDMVSEMAAKYLMRRLSTESEG